VFSSSKLTFPSRGFAAEAPETTLNGLSTLDTTYKPHVEEDKVVSIS
jgi:hypothetical protein